MTTQPRTTNYIGTFDHISLAGAKEIESARTAIRTLNKKLREEHSANQCNAKAYYARTGKKSYYPKLVQYYVKLQGRGPRVEAARHDGAGKYAYFSSLPLRHATHVDAYVYTR